jgi:hypothetical protein
MFTPLALSQQLLKLRHRGKLNILSFLYLDDVKKIYDLGNTGYEGVTFCLK